ncbi:hypothetical protein ACFFIX_03790 [Metabacillus herbersteinensis]|uniref:YfhD family protein n=1 Tax=Metabacillus herbersteinensis TaxID=283816 RepID=A0ABV6GAZ4_9BACI
MKKPNEEAAPNNNLSSAEIRTSELVEPPDREFSEELADGGERNELIRNQQKAPQE